MGTADTHLTDTHTHTQTLFVFHPQFHSLSAPSPSPNISFLVLLCIFKSPLHKKKKTSSSHSSPAPPANSPAAHLSVRMRQVGKGLPPPSPVRLDSWMAEQSRHDSEAEEAAGGSFASPITSAGQGPRTSAGRKVHPPAHICVHHSAFADPRGKRQAELTHVHGS